MAAAAEEGNGQRYHEFAQDLATYYVRVLQQPRARCVRSSGPWPRIPRLLLRPNGGTSAWPSSMCGPGSPSERAELLAEYERDRQSQIPPPGGQIRSPPSGGELALAEGRPQDAIAEFRQGREANVVSAAWSTRAGLRQRRPDGFGDRGVRASREHRWLQRVRLDASELATVYRQLGGLYEQRGELAKARRNRTAASWSCGPTAMPSFVRR